MTAKPPTIHDLLEYPSFKAMMKTVPLIPPTLAIGKPWQLWVVTHEGVWRTAQYETYPDIWRKAVSCIRDQDTYRDVCITSKRVMFNPGHLDWVLEKDHRGTSWCRRCRRPSVFKNWHASHHALKRQPVLAEDAPYRCYYCGIRKAAMTR